MEAQGDFYPRPPHRGPSQASVVLLAIVFGIMSGFGGTLLALWTAQHYHSTLLNAAQASGDARVVPLTSAGGAQNQFEVVADALDESVVNINTTAQSHDPIASFFGNGPQVVKGLGTGVIVDKEGYILTNFHVVENANKIMVTVMHRGGKHQYVGALVGGDKQEDLAVVKINNAKDLHPVTFGDSGALRPGEWVMAIGNPYGFEHSVSVGVVSALNRPLQVNDAVSYRNMIQTDASINPGNSGGPLVDLRGEVIGINSAVYVGGGGGEPQAKGIGFAIPSNHAVKIMKLLRDNKKIEHPYIGISYKQLSDEERSELHIPVKAGVYITAVMPHGPAAKAGVLQRDVLTSIDAKELTDQNSLSDYINNKEVGDQVTVTLQRWDDGTQTWTVKTLRLTLDNKPSNFEQQMKPTETPSTPQPQPENGDQSPAFPPW